MKGKSMTYNIHEAKTNFSKLVEQVQNGEKVIIAKSGNPIAQLIPFKNRLSKRIPGSAKGQVVIKPDFDQLPEEIMEGFYQ
jgi:prevent-host-death family protein